MGEGESLGSMSGVDSVDSCLLLEAEKLFARHNYQTLLKELELRNRGHVCGHTSGLLENGFPQLN